MEYCGRLRSSLDLYTPHGEARALWPIFILTSLRRHVSGMKLFVKVMSLHLTALLIYF
jgi:hypothetical protein